MQLRRVKILDPQQYDFRIGLFAAMNLKVFKVPTQQKRKDANFGLDHYSATYDPFLVENKLAQIPSGIRKTRNTA